MSDVAVRLKKKVCVSMCVWGRRGRGREEETRKMMRNAGVCVCMRRRDWGYEVGWVRRRKAGGGGGREEYKIAVIFTAYGFTKMSLTVCECVCLKERKKRVEGKQNYNVSQITEGSMVVLKLRTTWLLQKKSENR